MTDHEFTTWMKFASARFPGVARHMTHDGERLLTADEAQLRREAWMGIFNRVTLDQARDATELVFSGRIDKPTAWADLPAIIAEHAALENADDARKRATWVDGERTYKCPLCLDTGRVTIWHPFSVRRMLKGAKLFDSQTIYECSVRCSCRPLKEGENAKDIMLFDPAKHFRFGQGEHLLKPINGVNRPAQQAIQDRAMEYLRRWEPPAFDLQLPAPTDAELFA